MHLKVNVICIYFFVHKNATTARCSLGKDFSGNVAVLMFINDVTVNSNSSQLLLRIKFATKRIFQIWKTNRMTLFCNLFIKRPWNIITCWASQVHYKITFCY